MSVPLWDHLEDVGRRIRAARRLRVFLDFDGTLAPIVSHPAHARLAEETTQVLRALARLPDVAVALISGRDLADLRSAVGMEELTYAGNHGLEIAGPGLTRLETEAVAHSRELRVRAARIAARVARLPGVWVEFKGLTASVHYRQAADETATLLESIVADICHPKLRVTRGHKVYELRPPVDWHKGTAARWIIDQQAGVAGLSIAAGDDATDEDLFRALHDGITIRVGNFTATAAHYHVADPEDLARFLARLTSTPGFRLQQRQPEGGSLGPEA